MSLHRFADRPTLLETTLLDRLRTLVAAVVLLAVAATLLVTMPPGPASAAEQDQSLTSGLEHQEGIKARLAALRTIAELAKQPPSAELEEALEEADAHARKSVEHVRGDSVAERATFDLDEKVTDSLRPLRSGETADSYEQIMGDLVRADQIAAARELDAFLALPFTEETASVDKRGRPISRQQVIDNFMEEYELSVDAEKADDFEDSVQFAGSAWAKVHTAVLDYWTRFDPDGDILPNDREEAAGTDPDSADTDGDGLSDSVELLNTLTDPTAADTFDLGGDGEADLDSDGLSNIREIRLGTDPLDADTDGDTLRDSVEGDEFPSDPLLGDTDSDELTDDSERRFGTDPRDPDSDDDGVLDGKETYTSVVDDEATGFRVAMTGVGDVAKTVSVAEKTTSELYAEMPGRLSAAVDLTTERPFEEAEVSVEFDPAEVPDGDLDGLAIGYYDAEAGALVPLPTQVDESGRATAVSTHFTTFVLFYVPNWNAVFEQWDPSEPGGGGAQSADVVLALDSSSSMSWNDPQGLRREAAKRFVDGLIEGDRAAVVDFDGYARLYQRLTGDFAAVKAAIDRVDSSGGTNIGAGVSMANNELISGSGEGRVKAEILLTDGDGPYSSSLTQQAVDNHIAIYTIGLGSAVNENLLRSIASATGGQYFQVAQAEDLPKVFNRIGGDLNEGEDRDEDGLPDLDELRGVVTGTGLVVHTDPTDPDTDDDLLLDGDELSFARDWSAPYPAFFYKMWSNPHEEDSDGDGLTDTEEVDSGMDAMDGDMDGDDVADGEEYSRAWDYRNDNRDGDQYTDDEELDEGTNPFRYDPSLADRTRAFAAGALLGEVGYWLADRGIDTSISIAYPPTGIPQLSVGVGPLDICNVPFVRCDELVDFQPIHVERVEYVAGMITLGLIPFVDIAVAVRDAIGAALKGEWHWAIFEVIAGALGFFVPAAGDIPGIVKDVGKWLARSDDLVERTDELVEFVAKAADETPAADAILVPILKNLKPGTYETLARHVSDDNIKLIAESGQSLDELASVLKDEAVEVLSAGKWYDETAERGHWGREAENYIRGRFGGKGKRFPAPVDGGKFRILDQFFDDGFTKSANEVKTGDGQLTAEMQVQINKDKYLLDESGQIDDYTWNFFPSGRSHRVGPTPELLAELKEAGMKVKVWLP